MKNTFMVFTSKVGVVIRVNIFLSLPLGKNSVLVYNLHPLKTKNP